MTVIKSATISAVMVACFACIGAYTAPINEHWSSSTNVVAIFATVYSEYLLFLLCCLWIERYRAPTWGGANAGMAPGASSRWPYL